MLAVCILDMEKRYLHDADGEVFLVLCLIMVRRPSSFDCDRIDMSMRRSCHIKISELVARLECLFYFEI